MTTPLPWSRLGLVLIGAAVLTGASPAFGQESSFDLSQATPEAPGPWKIFVAVPRNIDSGTYVELPLRRDAQSRVAAIGASLGGTQAPYLRWMENKRVRLAPFSNRALHTPAFMPDRDVIVAWTCPNAGNWKIEAAIDNIGTDVDGGDGGQLTLSRLGPEDVADAGIFASGTIPTKKAETAPISLSKTVKLYLGDRILLRMNSGIDTYGDGFMLDYRIQQTEAPGESVVNKGFASVLADPPAQHAAPGAPLRSGLFWLGTDGRWANSEYAQESIDLIRKFIPDLAVVMVTGHPEQYRQPDFYRQDGLPTMIQTWGFGYEPWLRSQKAFEVNWEGTDLGLPGPKDLLGTAHAAALPHPATREAFTRVVQAAIRSGYTGFGYCDMIWMWNGGRGRSGYNPETIAAFRRDLLGQDEGLSLTLPEGRQAVFHFANYAAYYIGAAPRPEDVGITGWDAYSPLTKDEFQRRTGTDSTPQFLLFDLLVHYEWLKFNDYLGHVAHAEGGAYQCMPNPEDMANGGDLLFACRLNSVQAVGEEFFNSPAYLDAAYVRFGYMSGVHPAGLQPGVVMEGGGGGNGWPYYANEIAYATSYELALATRAEYFEGDFWPSQVKPLAETIKAPEFLSRYRQILAYGLGFKDARADAASRLPADFVSVTSRRIFRPWGQDWMAWTMNLNTTSSPDGILAKAGYSFAGVGEEGVDGLGDSQNVVLYTPDLPTEKGWRTILEKVHSGQIHHLIVMAPALREIVTTRLQRKPMQELFPDWNTAEDGAWATAAGTSTIAGPRFKLEGWETVASQGDQPTVVKKKVGEGWVYCLLFNATLPANAAIATATYHQLLSSFEVAPRWTAEAGVMVRLYKDQKGMLIAGVQSDDVRGWKKPPENPHDFRPYQVPATHTVQIQVPSNQEYAFLALPSGVRGQQTATADGLLSLNLKQTSHELFFIVPIDRSADLDAIAERKKTFDKAMTLNGLVDSSKP